MILLFVSVLSSDYLQWRGTRFPASKHVPVLQRNDLRQKTPPQSVGLVLKTS
jgi:hypothetical protein